MAATVDDLFDGLGKLDVIGRQMVALRISPEYNWDRLSNDEESLRGWLRDLVEAGRADQVAHEIAYQHLMGDLMDNLMGTDGDDEDAAPERDRDGS